MKKNSIFFTSLLVFLFIYSSAPAQTDSLPGIINDLSENETYVVELLLELQENPINLNEADRDELLSLPLLIPQMADSIISVRERYGRYSSKRQIRSITGPKLYKLIKNYLTVSQKKIYKFHLTQRNTYKIEKIREIESGKFEGNALNDYTRLKYQVSPNTMVGLVKQKDAGEKNYIDHLNFNLSYKNSNWYVLLGNFFLQMGQGLSHNNPYGNQKSIYLSSVFNKPTQIARPNLTSSESSGKFGLFLQNNLTSQLTIFSFYSNAFRDAQITDNSVTGFKYDGLHRSQSELQSKNKFKELNWGAGLKYNLFSAIRFITFFNKYSFNKKIKHSESVIGEKQKRRQYFNFSGSDLSQFGLAYSWHFNHLQLSGEMSSSDVGKPGWAQSVYFIKDKWGMGLKYWYLNNSFQSVDGRSFDNSDPFPQGVKGFFAGVILKPDKNNKFSAFKKYEQRLWRSYFNPMPTNKNEWVVQWDLNLKSTRFLSRFRSRISEGFSLFKGINQRIENDQKAIRLQLSYNPVKSLSSRTRWEYTYLDNLTEKGTLYFQELTYVLNLKLSLSMRFTLFNTSSFDSRIYEYERDLPGTFSNFALFGNGNKFYMLIKWKFVPNISFWFKWRYISKNKIFPNGKPYKALSRDLRLQIQINL